MYVCVCVCVCVPVIMSLEDQLQEAVQERNDAQALLKKLCRTCLTPGEEVEILAPESPEGSEFGVLVATRADACIVRMESGAEVTVERDAVFSRVVKGDDVMIPSEEVNPWRIAQLLDHRCNVRGWLG
ncbi:MAG: hypothetical protein P4L40_24535, partial [Terracidiphilus sp.]|nr:hypothetical protein [Terracidiphilus sp.]